ncbi:MAG: HlyD family efflux transporter periplasmic adaptor subunit [Peptococcaceae bacterium]|nr:HlyD family efflux transporter periplasmic adaptor subunit [Peptococcaceae bacterium]
MKLKKIIQKLRTMSLHQKVILGLFIVSLLIVAANSAYSVIHQYLIKTMTVGAAYTDVVYSDYGFIQAEESLITPTNSGSAALKVEEGKRVPKNHEVFSVTSSGEDGKEHTERYYAPISGIVSYHIDGYENMSDMDKIKGLDFRKIYEDTFNSDGNNHADKEAVSGEVYAKVIDNLKAAYIYMFYNPEDNHLLEEEGDTFRIRFPELNESTTGTVEDIVDNGDGRMFCKIALGPVSETFLTNRVVQAEIYQIETATLDLDKEALVYNDGDPGVYIVSGGTVQWQKVTVLHESENRVECENLPEGTVVVLTPNRVSSGDVVKGS